jgi:hypothetical protein
MDAIQVIEGRRGVGPSKSSTGYQKFESTAESKEQSKDRLQHLLNLVWRDGAVRGLGESGGGGNDNDTNGGRAAAAVEDWGWGSYEFDGIRSEVDFRRAMQLEEERLRGSWTQRTMRAVHAMTMSLLNLRALRFLR